MISRILCTQVPSETVAAIISAVSCAGYQQWNILHIQYPSFLGSFCPIALCFLGGYRKKSLTFGG